MLTGKINAGHLERRAIVYLRQSTLQQVVHHSESTRRQYGLRQRAIDLGWPEERVEVIDEDLGQSGRTTTDRTGFTRLAEGVASGRVGAILALEPSRFARSSADWHRLIELCGLADVVIVDEHTVYAPHNYDDRMVLGHKGLINDGEQHWMRLRLQGARLSKARRGEYRLRAPVGYVWDGNAGRFRFDPDDQVRRAVSLVFERFRLDGSARGVARWFARQGLKLPSQGVAGDDVAWILPSGRAVLAFIKSPVYTGTYVFGRRENRTRLVDGEVRHRVVDLPIDEWKVRVADRHPAYISWDEYLDNRRMLDSNATRSGWGPMMGRGAAREGRGLLQGLVLCGRCGHRMHTTYQAGTKGAYYQCRALARKVAGAGQGWSVSTRAIDAAVEALFLEAMQPPELELGLAVAREAERQAAAVDQQYRLALERARYEVRLAERRYKSVDPDNRVVAATLERDWELRLRALADVERERDEARRRSSAVLTEEDQVRILALARDLPRVWHASTTTHAERKNLLRMVVRDVTLTPIDVPRSVTGIQVLWRTGAVTELQVDRPRIRPTMTPPEVVARLRDLAAAGLTDREIAEQLTEQGHATARHRTWTASRVSAIRARNDISKPADAGQGRAPDQRRDGRLSINGVAAHFGVPIEAVRYWLKRGWLTAEVGGGHGRARWFRLDTDTEERLWDATRRRKDTTPVK